MSSKSSLRTPLGRVRFLGSAKSGTEHAWAMRATSAALVPLTIAFVWIVLHTVGKDYASVRDTLGRPLSAIILMLFLGTGIYHMKLGMQVIIEDYVHDEHLKTWSLLANASFCYAIGLACIYAILRISFV
jgi:succinate dehydrogenase / fumarate reductase membrane anchor subunit